MESSIWGGIVGLLGLLLGGGGLAAIITSRSQARKTDADAQAVEAKVGPEVDSIAVNALNVTTTALQAENARLVERLNQTLDTDRKSTRLNSSHVKISYAVFCLKKKKKHTVES